MKTENTGLEIAIVGLAGRFPDSQNIADFWENLTQGKESISVLETDAEASTLKAGAILDKMEWFDADFFGFSPREAEMMDPQHRIFLECAWSALEHAGYDSQRESRPIGLYAGVGASTYLLHNLLPNRLKESLGYFPVLIASDKDYVPTRVSYKLDLKGPSLSVGTACSSSLVAVHLACQGLLSGECDISLAAGVAIKAPQTAETLCPEGIAPDGHCRAFDAQAAGTLGGNGAGVVVLKRLEDAIAEGDTIYAMIKGCAVNNDGAKKVSYTAPSENAQARVIRSAQMMAEVEPETITYVEAHGTGTPMGDPIEMAALTRAFKSGTNANNSGPTAGSKTGYCAIGSVKTNIGHLDAAAGIAGLIKTTLALHNKVLPPSLNFETPNPQIDFANSPFYVNTQLTDWVPPNGLPRRAGVSSFGFGGTNAHVVLEEAPPVEPTVETASDRSWQVLLFSAKTASALDQMTENAAGYLHQAQPNLADVAYTLQVGRHAFRHRRMVVCQGIDDAVQALKDPQRCLSMVQAKDAIAPDVAFMFTGVGSQYVRMAEDLYQTESIFKTWVDRCCEILHPLLGHDLKESLYPLQTTTTGSTHNNQSKTQSKNQSKNQSKVDLRQMLGRAKTSTQDFTETHLIQPAVFVIEYALAQLWKARGVEPKAMLGYSLGEYVAATLAEVWSLEEGLRLVAQRAQMIEALPAGAMLAVPMPEAEVKTRLTKTAGLSLAAVNGPELCVVSGEPDAVNALAADLAQQGTACRPLPVSHAFHSAMMREIAEPLAELIQTFQLQPPKIPYLSNVTGTWITDKQATNPHYWTQHLCQPVRFAEGVKQLWENQQPILLEIGPGQTLSSLTLQCLAKAVSTSERDPVVLPTLRHVYEPQSDVAFALNTWGELWLSGVPLDGSALHSEPRRRVPLPTYPFERQRYWLDVPEGVAAQNNLLTHSQSQSNLQPDNLWTDLVAVGQQQAQAGMETLDPVAYQEQRQWLDRLCTAYLAKTFQQLGAFPEPEKAYALDEIKAHCQVIPRYRELVGRWLQLLVEQGALQQNEHHFSQLQLITTEQIETLLTEVRKRSPEILEWIDIYQCYGENMPAILTGEREPLEFHFSMKLQSDAQAVPDYPTQDYYKPILQAMVAKIVATLPAQTPLRILELGAGTGTATEALLPLLPAHRTQYTYTDVGSLFLSVAQTKFAAYPFVDYRLYDIEQTPTAQGYDLQNYDLIIAFNVLHVARDLDTAVTDVRSLLAPQGLLCLWEITQGRLEADLMDAVLMNPMVMEEKTSDNLETKDRWGRDMGAPFLSAEQWTTLLHAHDFDKVSAFSEFPDYGEHILLAQASGQGLDAIAPAFTQPSQLPSRQKPDLSDWFYLPTWVRTQLPVPHTSKNSIFQGHWLVFLNKNNVEKENIGLAIAQKLKAGGATVITVQPGPQFSSEPSLRGLARYQVNPNSQKDYDQLFQALAKQNALPQSIVYAWTLDVGSSEKEAQQDATEPHSITSDPGTTNPGRTNSETPDPETPAIGQHFYQLLFLAQAWTQQAETPDLNLTIISNHLQLVIGNESLSLEKSGVLGLLKVLPQEYPHIHVRSLDIESAIEQPSTQHFSHLVERLLIELSTTPPDTTALTQSSLASIAASTVAYRGKHRWCQTLQPIRLPALTKADSRFRNQGVYLITGGLGNLGLTLADYLAQTFQAKLILLGRSAFPLRKDWVSWLEQHDSTNTTSRKIQTLLQLESSGAEVLVIQADVSEGTQMQQAISQLQARFGRLNGVIHAAGIAGELSPISQLTFADCEQQFRAKIQGLQVLSHTLNQLTQDQPLDFCLLMSSLVTVLGGRGLLPYTTANLWMNSFAQHQEFMGSIPWISVNWDTWKTQPRSAQPGDMADFSLSPDQGTEALERILHWGNFNQILVSTGDLSNRLVGGSIALAKTKQSSDAISTVGNSLEAPSIQPSQRLGNHRPRPQLKTTYVPPSRELERQLVAVFKKFLGFETVGIYDSFFVLGGDSLTGSILINQLRDQFQIDLPVRSLFESPTVADLANAIEILLIEDLDQLTEEEASSLLRTVPVA